MKEEKGREREQRRIGMESQVRMPGKETWKKLEERKRSERFAVV